jgi:hypothetical protein
MAQRKSRRSGYTVKVKAGPATVNIFGKTKKKAVANGRHFVKKYMKNIEQGFYAGGVFHPIRASSDYSARRAGEAGKTRARRFTPKKKAAKRK